jgi:hypothetical protein
MCFLGMSVLLISLEAFSCSFPHTMGSHSPYFVAS